MLSRLLQARDDARLAGGAAPALPHLPPITAKRAALNAIARAFEHMYQLPSTPLEMSPAAITLAEMAELLPQPALLSVVEGQGETIGVVAICPNLMTALIELQTIGRLTARPVDTRRPTRSDAIICADFINALLDELGGEMARIDGFENFEGFRYASFLEDQRALLLMLEDCPYRSLRYSVRLGHEPAREGQIFVALPQKAAVAALAPPVRQDARPGGAAAAQDGRKSGPDLSGQMAQAPIEVVGVLCRRKMRLGDLRDLREGQLLPLPRVDLAQTRLETGSGQLLAIGKLGEADGNHAIRLRREGDQPEAEPDLHRAGGQTARPDLPSNATAQEAPGQNPAVSPEPPIADLSLPDSFRSAGPDEDRAGETPAGAAARSVVSGRSAAAAPQKAVNTG